MGVSTDGEISFGFVFEEGFAFPWDCEESEGKPWHGSLDDWWRHVNGFEHKLPDPYDEHGNYKPGFSKDSPGLHEYHQEAIDWDRANPLPVNEVNYCSGDYPMYMLAVPDVGLTARRGCPEVITEGTLTVREQQKSALIEFCKKYGITTDGEPKWWLTSYWG